MLIVAATFAAPPPGTDSILPLFHSGLDFHRLVAAEDNADVDLAGVGLLLPQEVVDAGFDVGPEPGDRKSFGGVPVLGALRVPDLVAVVAHEAAKLKGLNLPL
jgi:hypothetical protein